jgi:hypothetical protein
LLLVVLVVLLYHPTIPRMDKHADMTKETRECQLPSYEAATSELVGDAVVMTGTESLLINLPRCSLTPFVNEN